MRAPWLPNGHPLPLLPVAPQDLPPGAWELNVCTFPGRSGSRELSIHVNFATRAEFAEGILISEVVQRRTLEAERDTWVLGKRTGVPH